uniref:NADH-ubiquinone oxidoreductase chain 3 n=1 Tax=Glossosoma caudatum TaxID=2904899 RepID=A0A9E8LP87_9NEOP|nr:NADH dehydrogenase subunit 3 [Glossosoma caudatum]UZZ43629.1 NADH dehydrogenase subunit 3 [Glossosoma caudatum]
MMTLLSFSMILMVISNIVMALSIILSKKIKLDREKASPFECGFDPKSSSRLPFSLHFFLIMIIFLIFDVEIALIMPMIITYQMCNILIWYLTSLFFLLILIIGLFHEWNQGMLQWTL